MHLIPTQEEVVSVLRETGALRDGHFEYPTGLHSNEYLQVPLAMRHYQQQRMLSVGLSRLLRANPEIRAIMPELSIVAPATGGLPVAYGVCEALRAKQVYWAERDQESEAAALPSIPGAAARRAGRPGGRHPADRQQPGGIEANARSQGRPGGGAGGHHLSAHAQYSRFRISAALLPGQAGSQLLLPTAPTASCASRVARWRKCGYNAQVSHKCGYYLREILG